MKYIFTFILGFVFISTAFADGYKINLNIKGEKNKEVHLGVYYGANMYSRDTAVLDNKGKGQFAGNKLLIPGMYLLIIDGAKTIDFIIASDTDQNFTISFTKENSVETVEIEGSEENKAFADYTRYMVNRQKKEHELQKQIAANKDNKEFMSNINAEMDVIREDNRKKVAEIGEKFPGSFIYSIVHAMEPVYPNNSEIPEKDETRFLYEYIKTHFWDNFTLTDSRLQNTPILIPALDAYLNSVLVQIPDTIINATDRLLSKTDGDTVMTRFIAGHVFNNYFKSKIMGMESVVVHLIDNYYLTDKIQIHDEEFNKGITKFADENRETLIGKKAKSLKMQSINGMYESLYDIDAQYTLIYFYEPTCGHCKEETPKIQEIFEKYKDKGVAAVGVYTQQNKQEWQTYVTENNLTDWINVWDPQNENNYRTAYSIVTIPQLYLLDKDKNIIGRRLDSVALAQMLDHFLKNK